MPLYLPHYNLQPFNSLASPVFAGYFVSVKTQEEILEALTFARERELPLLILGGGSNVVLHDDFNGLVIHLLTKGKTLVAEDDQHYYIKAAAGENWHEFVEYCLDHHYWGLENLSLIPGSVGAAPIQNIGAYGVELKDVFAELTAVDICSGLSVTFTHDACQFDYRDSVFKQALKDQYIITSVTFKLFKSPQMKVHYPALAAELPCYDAAEITPELVSQVVCRIRQSKLPDPSIIPNVGSFFKNPIVDANQLASLKQQYPNVVHYSHGEKYKLAAAWLIDQAGWKGYQGEACVHHQQALVLTNPHKVKAAAVLGLALFIETSILEKFGVQLEQEPRNYP